MSNKYDVYNENCPTRKILDVISDKWVILIIDKLSQRTYRFLELKREIGGISQKVLANTLRKLEQNGFILRLEYDVLPLKVEYSLTKPGQHLGILFNGITQWAETHMDDLLQAQKTTITPC